MEFHGIGEPFIDMIFRRLLEEHKVNFLPPGVIKGVDYLATESDFVFIELEDTVAEVYNAVQQVIRICSIAEIYNAYVVIAVPLPENLSSLRAPLAYFFAKTRKFKIKRELWILTKNRILKLYENGKEPSKVLNRISVNIPIKTIQGILSPEITREIIKKLKTIVC